METKKILPPPFANIQSDQRTKKYQKLCFAQETSSRENTYQTEKVLFCFTQSGRMSQNKTFYWCLIRLTNPILGECLLLNCLISGFQLQVGVTAQLELLEQTALVAQWALRSHHKQALGWEIVGSWLGFLSSCKVVSSFALWSISGTATFKVMAALLLASLPSSMMGVNFSLSFQKLRRQCFAPIQKSGMQFFIPVYFRGGNRNIK